MCKPLSDRQTTQCKPTCFNAKDPCLGQMAVCEQHHCVLVPDEPAPTDGCFAEQPCPPSEGMCFSPGQKLPCGICFNPEPSEVCTSDAKCKAQNPTSICEFSVSSCVCSGESLCVPGCKSGAQCELGKACNTANHCVPKPCSTDGDCPTINFQCAKTNTGAMGCTRKSCQFSGALCDYCVNGQCHENPGFCSFPPP